MCYNESVEIRDWLRQQMDERNINALSLSYGLRTSHVTIGKWLEGTYVPNPKSCRKLAQFFGVPEEQVLTLAGHLHPGRTVAEAKGDYSTNPPGLGEAINLFRSLTDDDQERILIYMRALVRSQRSERRRAEGPIQESPAPG